MILFFKASVALSGLLLSPVLLLLLTSTCVSQLYENERIDEYYARSHTWPPKDEDFIPNTPGWRSLINRRIRQLEQATDSGNKYSGYMSLVHQAFIGSNFTENGWGLTKAPQQVIDELQDSLRRGLAANPPEEYMEQCIETANRPLYIYQEDLNQRVLNTLLPIHESWSGVKLIPNNAYGLRVYRNESSLNMHIDKSNTHIISSILHVDHDPMGDPWPIVIEDFQGNTHEVTLEAGDMLLYESSKCLHGRPKKFNGSWYTSLFIHYYPEDWNGVKINLDTHYRIPPTWSSVKPREEGLEPLEFVETSVKEPTCEHQWCALKNSIKSGGPAPGYGRVLSTGGVVKELKNIPDENEYE